ncbi:hypothetical protein [Dyella sp. 2RAB6]|uniref:hypothetical protein n=1 Tax=Dyella sp. 2RAB6 TaxID=3232992 RepID=UPI003F91F00C
MSWTRILESALVIVALLNLIVSVAVARSESLTPGQKLGQLLIVWLMPPLGVTLIGLFMWTQRGKAPATGYLPVPHEHTGHIYQALNSPAPPPWNSGNGQ